MLPNAYFLAKIRFDTAENEPFKFWQKTFANFAAEVARFHHRQFLECQEASATEEGGRQLPCLAALFLNLA